MVSRNVLKNLVEKNLIMSPFPPLNKEQFGFNKTNTSCCKTVVLGVLIMAVGEHGRDEGGGPRQHGCAQLFLTSSLTSFRINTCQVLRMEVGAEGRTSSLRWKTFSMQGELGADRQCVGERTRCPGAEFWIPDGRRDGVHPKERGWFHVNRVFATVTSSNA